MHIYVFVQNRAACLVFTEPICYLQILSILAFKQTMRQWSRFDRVNARVMLSYWVFLKRFAHLYIKEVPLPISPTCLFLWFVHDNLLFMTIPRVLSLWYVQWISGSSMLKLRTVSFFWSFFLFTRSVIWIKYDVICLFQHLKPFLFLFFRLNTDCSSSFCSGLLTCFFCVCSKRGHFDMRLYESSAGRLRNCRFDYFCVSFFFQPSSLLIGCDEAPALHDKQTLHVGFCWY